MAGFLGMTRRITRSVASRGRLLAMLGVAAVGIGIAVLIDRAEDPTANEWAQFLAGFGLTVYVPLVVLVIATAALGTLVEEKTLVYFWLRPVGRSQISLAAMIASLIVLVPLVLGPMAVLGAIAGGGDLLTGVLAASALGILGYGAVFTFLGLLTQRALIWGLLYILVWEGFVAGLSRTAGWLALRTHTTSVLGDIADVPELIANPTQRTTALIITAGVVVVSFLLTTLRLRRMDVD